MTIPDIHGTSPSYMYASIREIKSIAVFLHLQNLNERTFIHASSARDVSRILDLTELDIGLFI